MLRLKNYATFSTNTPMQQNKLINAKEQFKNITFYRVPCILAGLYGFVYAITYFSIRSRLRSGIDYGGLTDVVFSLINLLPSLLTGIEATVASLNSIESGVLFSAGLLTYLLIGVWINFLRFVKELKRFFSPRHVVIIFIIIIPLIGYNLLIRNQGNRYRKIATEKNNLFWCNFTFGNKAYCQMYVTVFNNHDIFSCKQIHTSDCDQWQLDRIVQAREYAKATKFVSEAKRDAKCIDGLINNVVNPAGKEYTISTQGEVFYDICVANYKFTTFCVSSEDNCYLQEYSCATPTDTNAVYDKLPDGVYRINTKCERGCQNGACVVYK